MGMVGQVIGSIGGGVYSDKFGRKNAIIVSERLWMQSFHVLFTITILVNIQSFAKDWRILIVLKTWKMRQSLACQFLACQFSTAFFRNFSVQKLTFINKPPSFGVFYRNFWSKLKLCGIDRVSELLRKWFWSKIGDLDEAHQKFLEFWNFREFLENASIFGERLYVLVAVRNRLERWRPRTWVRSTLLINSIC